MNKIQERRVELRLTQSQVSKGLKRVEARCDIGMVSRYEKGVCLPTAPQLDKLEEILQADRLSLYNAADLDLLKVGAPGQEKAAGNRKKDTRSQHCLHKCYRVPREFAATMPEDLLEVCGFVSWNDWHATCLRRLLGEYAARMKAKKNRRDLHEITHTTAG